MKDVRQKGLNRESRAAPLSRRRVAEAALKVIDEDGVEAASARRIARELGCEAMSLYHHFDTMDDILDEVVDLLFASLAPAPETAPRRALLTSARRFLALAERHPAAFSLIAGRRWRTPAALAFVEDMLAHLEALGLAPALALSEGRMLGAYLNGAGLALAAWRLAVRRGQPPPSAEGGLAGYAPRRTASAVRADLDRGLERMIDTLGT